jgi:uncharacterized protein YukE
MSTDKVLANVNSSIKEVARQNELIGEIAKEVEYMTGVWQSEAQQVYTDKFRENKKDLDAFNRNLDIYLVMVRDAVGDLINVDVAVEKSLLSVRL